MQNPKTDDKFFTPPLVIVFVTIFIDLVGFGIVIPLLTFYAEEFQATPLDVGLLMAVYSLMQFVFAPIWGNLSDRIGRRPVLFWTILGSTVGYLMLGFAGSLAMVYAGRIVAGITGGNLATAQAYIADVTTRENRARGMGLFGMAFGLGFIFGPAIGGVLSQFGTHVPFLFAAVLSFVNAVLLYFILPESRHKTTDAAVPKVGRLTALMTSMRERRFATLVIDYFLLVMSFSMMTTSFAYLTLVKFGYGAAETGYLLAFVGLLAAVIQGVVFGGLARRFGEVRLVVAGSFVLALTMFAVPYVGQNSGGLIALLIVVAAFAIGNSIASPALTSLASKTAADNEQGQALGILQSSASLARAIGPLITGLLLNNAIQEVDEATLTRTYWTGAGIMAVALVASFYLAKISDLKFSSPPGDAL